MAVKSNPSKKAEGSFEEKGTASLGTMVMMDGDNVRFDLESGVTISLKKDDLPKNVKFKPGRSAKVSVTPNKTNTKVIYVNPASGDYEFRFTKFAGAEDTPPTPKEKEGKYGTYSETYALMEITDGVWKGSVFPLKLSMKWLSADEDGNLEVIGDKDYAQRWRDFFDVTGVSAHPEMLRYSENPLPDIQRIAQEADTKFKGVVVRGWIETIYSNLEADDDFDDEPTMVSPEPEEIADNTNELLKD